MAQHGPTEADWTFMNKDDRFEGIDYGPEDSSIDRLIERLNEIDNQTGDELEAFAVLPRGTQRDGLLFGTLVIRRNRKS